jgi:hypothetical protein
VPWCWPPARGFVLDDAAHRVLAAVVPVLLQGAIEQSQVPLAIARIDDAIRSLPLNAQSEVQELFALLSLTPARRFLAGLSVSWEQAGADEVHAFLQRWRFSRFALLQSAYLALRDLALGAWYADESTWSGIGYPGPIKELS